MGAEWGRDDKDPQRAGRDPNKTYKDDVDLSWITAPPKLEIKVPTWMKEALVAIFLILVFGYMGYLIAQNDQKAPTSKNVIIFCDGVNRVYEGPNGSVFVVQFDPKCGGNNG